MMSDAQIYGQSFFRSIGQGMRNRMERHDLTQGIRLYVLNQGRTGEAKLQGEQALLR
jgi:hypothetical protein